MTNRCGNPECGRPFGLIRRSWQFEQFCSRRCCETYQRQLQRNRAYWKWLCYCPAPAAHRKNLVQRLG